MRTPIEPSNASARALRAGVSHRTESPSQPLDGTRRRRGVQFVVPTAWRRCTLGTNHIACFGVWRQGTRRMALRCNRSGETRWHKPYRGAIALALPAVGEAVNED